MTLAAAATTEASTRDRILDAAELLFAREGLAGAAMKAIAAEAGVAQGLLHYHFAGKDGLYAAVVARRSAQINAARSAALDGVDFGAPDALERVFAALMRAPLGPEGGGAAYARIFATLVVGDARDRALVAEHYDPVARAFIAAIRRAEPRADQALAAWGYCFALGALIGVVARDGRPERLAGSAAADETEALIDRLVAFCAGGLRGMLEGGPHQ
ncbi:MAG: TetR/AcrR family transcriptional regulator [Gemmobacter sp.]